jgi:hypothetical protein
MKEILDNDNHTPKTEHELTILLNNILEQNFLQLNDQFYKQN